MKFETKAFIGTTIFYFLVFAFLWHNAFAPKEIAFIVIPFWLITIGFLYFLFTGRNTFELLDRIIEEAKKAKTKNEILIVFEKLDSAGKECWHKSHVAKYNKILGYLQGKYELAD